MPIFHLTLHAMKYKIISKRGNILSQCFRMFIILCGYAILLPTVMLKLEWFIRQINYTQLKCWLIIHLSIISIENSKMLFLSWKYINNKESFNPNLCLAIHIQIKLQNIFAYVFTKEHSVAQKTAFNLIKLIRLVVYT